MRLDKQVYIDTSKPCPNCGGKVFFKDYDTFNDIAETSCLLCARRLHFYNLKRDSKGRTIYELDKTAIPKYRTTNSKVTTTDKETGKRITYRVY